MDKDMHKFGKLIMELDRADCAYLQIYENGVVMVGQQVESEYGFDGFWGKIAKKALMDYMTKLANDNGLEIKFGGEQVSEFISDAIKLINKGAKK